MKKIIVTIIVIGMFLFTTITVIPAIGMKITSSLTLKWTFDPLGDETWGSINLEDVDADGYLEILFSSGFEQWTGSKPGWTYVLRHDGSLQPGWPIQTNSEPFHVPVAANIDPSYSGLEIITTTQVPHSFVEYIHAWHCDGTNVPGWPIKGGTTQASPAVGDVDNDNLLEVIYPVDVGHPDDWGLHVRNGDGNELIGWPVLFPDYSTCSTPAIADIDNDGDLEIIITNLQKVHVFHHDGSEMNGWPKNGWSHPEGPVLGDIDKDGDLEIFVRNSTFIYAFHHNGEIVNGWPVSIGDCICSTGLALGDINKDGDIDIISQACDNVYAWNFNGELLSGWPVTGNYCCLNHAPILGDIDGDETIEVIITTNDGLDAFHFDGNRVIGFPMRYPKENIYTMGAPALGDIDADGKLELIAIIEGEVMAWDCEGSRVEWPMFQYDSWNTGLYNYPPNAPEISGETDGNAGTEYDYTLTATDPEDDAVKYFIDWGDGNTEWTDYYESGEEIIVSHTWDEQGTYTISAKAKDIHGAESDWGNSITVKIKGETAVFQVCIKRGLGRSVSTNIKNNGETEINDIAWNLTVRRRGIFSKTLLQKNGTISTLGADSTETVVGSPSGLERIKIKVYVTAPGKDLIVKEANGFILFRFVWVKYL